MDLICISVMISEVEHLFVSCWPSVYLLWRNVYLGLLPYFDWIVCFFCYLFYELFVYFEYEAHVGHFFFLTNLFSHSIGVFLFGEWFPLLYKSFDQLGLVSFFFLAWGN